MTCRIPILLVLIVLAGCQATQAPVAGGPAVATFQGRTLETTLDPSVRVEAVLAAADAVLWARGYSVEKRRVTDDWGSVSARPAGAGFMERIVVRGSRQGTGTVVAVRVEPLGHEATSRGILDDIVSRLTVRVASGADESEQ